MCLAFFHLACFQGSCILSYRSVLHSFLWPNNSPWCEDNISFIQFSTDGHLGGFHVLIIITMLRCPQVSVWT